MTENQIKTIWRLVEPVYKFQFLPKEKKPPVYKRKNDNLKPRGVVKTQRLIKSGMIDINV